MDQVRLVVTLTTLLVLYTLFSNTSKALPDTAYIKMIDMWFLYCISILFVIIIVHIFAEHLDTGGKGTTVQPVQPVTFDVKHTTVAVGVKTITTSRGEKLLRVLRVVVVPAAVVTFNTIFWAVLLLSPK